MKLDAWWWQGFGSPSIAAQLHPFFVMPAVAVGVLGSYGVLLTLCILIWSASSGGMVALLRDRFGASEAGALSGAAAYAFAPLVVVKMVAGHLAFLAAYAVAPLAIWSAMALDLGSVAILAVALAIASIQLQVFGLEIGLVLLFRKLPLRYVALAIAAAICTAMPHLWTLLRPGTSVVTLGMKTSLPWELTLSSPIGQAFLGLGYFAPYWPQATASQFIVDRFLPVTYAIGIVGAVFATRCDVRFRLVAIYALGVLLVAGLYGPLSTPLWLAFSKVPAFSALRELYDMALLIAFSGACAYAVVVSCLPTRTAWVVAVCTSAIAILPWADGLVLAQTSPAAETAGLAAILDGLSAESPWSRILILPPVNPSGSIADHGAGADPLALPYRSLLPLWIYLPTGFQPEYLWMLAQRSEAIDSNLGISAILAHTNFLIKDIGPPTLVNASTAYSEMPLVPRELRGETVNADLSLYRMNNRAQIVQLVPARFPALTASDVRFESEHGADPTLTSAPIVDYWYTSQRLAEGAPSGSFTLAQDSQIKVLCMPIGRKVQIALLGQGFFSGRRVRVSSWKNVVAACGHEVDLKPKPLLAVTSTADIQNWNNIHDALRAPRLRVDRLMVSGDTITAAVGPCKRCSLMLMEEFDPGWTMAGPNSGGVKPSNVGGFNEWNVDIADKRVIRLEYEPTRGLSIALALSLAAWSGIGFALIIAGVKAIAPRK